MNTLDKIQAYKRELLVELLKGCTEKQRSLWFKAYKSVEACLQDDATYEAAVGLIERTFAMTKSRCAGCYNDDYNRGLGGAKECWSYSTAQLIKRKQVHMNDVPPWNKQEHEPKLLPDCYRKQGFVFVDPERTC